MGDFIEVMKKVIQKFIARIFGIKTKNIVQKKIIYTLRDREFTDDETKYIADFLNGKIGGQLCNYFIAQRYAIADKCSSVSTNADFWQGYTQGYKSAINHFLEFRQSDGNDTQHTSSESREVGLEELADLLDDQ